MYSSAMCPGAMGNSAFSNHEQRPSPLVSMWPTPHGPADGRDRAAQLDGQLLDGQQLRVQLLAHDCSSMPEITRVTLALERGGQLLGLALRRDAGQGPADSLTVRPPPGGPPASASAIHAWHVCLLAFRVAWRPDTDRTSPQRLRSGANARCLHRTCRTSPCVRWQAHVPQGLGAPSDIGPTGVSPHTTEHTPHATRVLTGFLLWLHVRWPTKSLADRHLPPDTPRCPARPMKPHPGGLPRRRA